VPLARRVPAGAIAVSAAGAGGAGFGVVLAGSEGFGAGAEGRAWTAPGGGSTTAGSGRGLRAAAVVSCAGLSLGVGLIPTTAGGAGSRWNTPS